MHFIGTIEHAIALLLVWTSLGDSIPCSVRGAAYMLNRPAESAELSPGSALVCRRLLRGVFRNSSNQYKTKHEDKKNKAS